VKKELHNDMTDVSDDSFDIDDVDDDDNPDDDNDDHDDDDQLSGPEDVDAFLKELVAKIDDSSADQKDRVYKQTEEDLDYLEDEPLATWKKKKTSSRTDAQEEGVHPVARRED